MIIIINYYICKIALIIYHPLYANIITYYISSIKQCEAIIVNEYIYFMFIRITSTMIFLINK